MVDAIPQKTLIFELVCLGSIFKFLEKLFNS
jgi:hypothetical protein